MTTEPKVGRISSDLEITAQFVGGPDVYPRFWGPERIRTSLDGHLTAHLIPHTANIWIRVGLGDFTALEGGWYAATLSVEDINGWLIGRRPCMFYNRIYDVPTFTNLYVPSEQMNCAVGIRRLA